MILRLSTPAQRIVLLLVALAFTAIFAYAGVRDALAEYCVGLNSLAGFERATRLEPSDARNWYLLGRYWQYNLDDPETQKAIRAYQKSLSLDPHSSDAWSDLATAYETENDLAAARDAFLQAKHAYPLSPEVAWRFGNFLLRRGELNAAFAEIRHAVEVDPKRGAAAFALCIRVNPDFDAVLRSVLPNSPQAYLSVISALAARNQADQALLLWARLTELHPRLVLTDSNELIDALVHNNRMMDARRVWNDVVSLSSTPPLADPPASLVWDGGFESRIVNTGLSWSYSPFANGVQAILDAKEKHSGNLSLRLTFNGLQNVDFHDVCQSIAVRPSTTYLFSAWVQTRSLSTDQGVRFGLIVPGSSVNNTVWTDDVRGTQPWTQLRLAWTSPADAQRLLLCAARNPSAEFDRKIHGLAWIDDIALLPASAEHAAQ